MASIQIFANGIVLDFVHDSLTVNRENNAFITDFKVSHSSFPFLIIENTRTKEALGPREIASLGKKKVVDVVVIESGQTYSGQLCTLNYINGFRKCDLKYGSSALSILDKKLSGLLPVLSIIPGFVNPVPFTETALSTVPGYLLFPEFAAAQLGKIFPEVNYTFPMMFWQDKFGEALEVDDEWFPYQNYYNHLRGGNGNYVPNYFTIIGDNVIVSNGNVPSPQLFALGVLKMAFEGIGWTIAGDFVTSAFARRLLVLSSKDNLCAVPVAANPHYFNYSNFVYSAFLPYRFYRHTFTPDSAGEYYLNYHSIEPLRPGGIAPDNPLTYLAIKHDGNTTPLYKNFNEPGTLDFSGQHTFIITEEQLGQTITIEWGRHNTTPDVPPLFFEFAWGMTGKTFYMMHPTLELGRYAPDWNLAEFINELKLKFCLDVALDDLSQVATFNFAKDILISPNKFVTAKKLTISEYAPPENFGIVMKGPEGDPFILITPEGVTNNSAPESDYIEKIESKFKLVPNNSLTADIGAAEDKDGVGLMIYDPQLPENAGDVVRPLISPDYNGYTLSIAGTRGTYNTYWREVIQMKLHGSTLTMEGPFTDQEVRQLQRMQKTHINNQEYIILGIELKATLQGNNQVKFNLQSVTL
jgi:hypothetical protein